MPLFEVAFVRVPSVAEQEQGKGETLMFGPKPIVASNEASASSTAGAMAGKEGVDLTDPQIRTLVRSFRG